MRENCAPVIRRTQGRLTEIATAAAASTLVSIFVAVISPRRTDSYKSHLLFAVAAGILLLILPSFRSGVLQLDAGLVFVFCCFEPVGRVLLHQEEPPHYFIFALVLVLAVAYLVRSNSCDRPLRSAEGVSAGEECRRKEGEQ